MKRYFWLLLMATGQVWADVATVAVEAVNLPQLHPLVGRVEAVNQATMTAQTSGRIAELYFDVNDLVQKGEPLARLRNQQQKAELDAAQAEFERAGSEFKRVSDLYARKLVAQAALDQSRAGFKAAEARLNSAREGFDFTLIRAPYSGIVTKRHVEVGESVRPGSPLVSGLALNQLRVAVDVPSSLVVAVRQHKQAQVEISPSQIIHADKLTVFPYADELSHSFTARIDLPIGAEGAVPGMLLTVNFVTGDEAALLVPQTAVVNRGELTAVYVRQADGRIVMRQVRVGRVTSDGKQMVHAGIAAGEQVFVDPQVAVVLLKKKN